MESDLQLDSNLLNVPIPLDEEQLPPIAQMLPLRGNITPEIIEELESDLDFYEQVSLVFLLYDNVEYALQQFKVKSASRNERLGFSGLLSEWAYKQQGNSSNWEEKFLEAICIVQNYLVVEKLGYRKLDAEELFLPRNQDTSLNVDLLRKAFYIACERLSNEQEKRLLELVKEDVGSAPPAFIDEAHFLEIHFLYWMSQQYISLQDRTVDISNFKKNLKKMELYSLIDYLDAIVRRYQKRDETSRPVPATENSVLDDDQDEISSTNTDNIPSHSDVGSVLEENFMNTVSDRGCYTIDPKNMGYCVIINQKTFYREPNAKLKEFLPCDDLEDRVGTDVDRDRLSEAFGNFGFKVKIWENLDHVNVLASIDEAVKDLVEEKHSCFVLCILSHGILNQVYGVNSIPVSVDEIHMKIQGKNCPKLINKPKIIIIQACQGQVKQDVLREPGNSLSDVAADGPSHRRTAPEISDSVIGWSTVPGYASYRDKSKGSWFIQTLCDVLLNSTTGVQFCDVMLAVNDRIKNKVAVFGNCERKAMQPVFTITISKKLFWPCNVAARKTVAEMMIKRHLFDEYLDEFLIKEYRYNRNA